MRAPIRRFYVNVRGGKSNNALIYVEEADGQIDMLVGSRRIALTEAAATDTQKNFTSRVNNNLVARRELWAVKLADPEMFATKVSPSKLVAS